MTSFGKTGMPVKKKHLNHEEQEIGYTSSTAQGGGGSFKNRHDRRGELL
jgi:hypothetical protein